MAEQKIGRYEVIGELGKGAMGLVYKALDPTIGRTVALKTMRTDVHGMESEEMLKRFQNEARAAGVLNHPNIITVYDAGEIDGLFFIAMELMEGVTLHSILVQQHTLPAEKVIEISRQVLPGLDYAHAHGVIHRDVKPANIMIAPDGTAKIMDFGIAKAGGGMTSAGQVLGTPNYMAPEQVKGRPLDGRSDLFSYGVILYEMVTGEKPFTGQNVTTIIYKIIHEEPIPPRELDVTIHPGLSAVIQRSLAKNPDERYQRGAELVRDLENYKSLGGLGDTTSVMQSSGPIPIGADSGTTMQMPSSGAQEASVARAEAMAAAAAGGVAVAAAPGSGSYAVAPEPPSPPALPKLDSTVNALPKKAPATAAKKSKSAGVLIAVAVLVIAALGMGWYRVRQKHERELAEQQQQLQQQVQPPQVVTPPTTATSPPPQPATSAQTTPAPKPSATKPSTTTAPPTTTATATTPIPTPTPNTPAPPIPAGQAMLNITSSPAGAKVYIDGNDSGKFTPVHLPVPKGDHEIKLKKEGFKDVGTKATVDVGQSFTYGPALQPGSSEGGNFFKHLFGAGIPEGKCEIKVKPHPKNAKVTIDGGKYEGNKAYLDPGIHHISISADGYKPITKTVSVDKGKSVEVEETLTKK
jgi:eukaryotic-like serine/threonine-protein kinase